MALLLAPHSSYQDCQAREIEMFCSRAPTARAHDHKRLGEVSRVSARATACACGLLHRQGRTVRVAAAGVRHKRPSCSQGRTVRVAAPPRTLLHVLADGVRFALEFDDMGPLVPRAHDWPPAGTRDEGVQAAVLLGGTRDEGVQAAVLLGGVRCNDPNTAGCPIP
eukprot:7081346-Prymnesium_polylepis.1